MSESGLRFTRTQMPASLMEWFSAQQPLYGFLYQLRGSLVSSRMNELELRFLQTSFFAVLSFSIEGHFLTLCVFFLFSVGCSLERKHCTRGGSYHEWFTSGKLHFSSSCMHSFSSYSSVDEFNLGANLCQKFLMVYLLWWMNRDSILGRTRC